jgi:hypothetical protein
MRGRDDVVLAADALGCAVGSNGGRRSRRADWVRRGVRRVTSGSPHLAADPRRHTRGGVELRFTQRVHRARQHLDQGRAVAADPQAHSGGTCVRSNVTPAPGEFVHMQWITMWSSF